MRYIYDMITSDVLRTIFPSIIVDNFDLKKVETKSKEEEMHIYLEENKVIPEELRERQVISYGMTEESVIQDFPIRGHSVYLHIKRRKWQDKSDDTIHVRHYDINFEGTQLTKEFVSFLKEADRKYRIER